MRFLTWEGVRFSMRIAIFMGHYRVRGGAETCAYVLTAALNRLGITPDLYVRVNHPDEVRDLKKDIEENFFISRIDFHPHLLVCDKFSSRPPIGRFKQESAAYQVIPTILGRYDWIYDFTEGLPFASNGGAYTLYWALDDRSVMLRRERFHRRRSGGAPGVSHLLTSWRKRLFYGGYYQLIVYSQYARTLVRDFLDRDAEVIYPPVRLDRFPDSGQYSRSGVVMWSRFAPYKRQMEAVKFVESLEGEGLNVRLTLCGSNDGFAWYYREVEEYVRDHGLSQVRLVPNPSLTEASAILSRALIYLHLMEGEPFGITTAEAISSGCIPLVHDSGGQREIVPLPHLRFSTIQELRRLLLGCISEPSRFASVVPTLQDHIRKFSDERFACALLESADCLSQRRREG